MTFSNRLAAFKSEQLVKFSVPSQIEHDLSHIDLHGWDISGDKARITLQVMPPKSVRLDRQGNSYILSRYESKPIAPGMKDDSTIVLASLPASE